jgi:hypothetical protein
LTKISALKIILKVAEKVTWTLDLVKPFLTYS